jgi:hypothetical protein
VAVVHNYPDVLGYLTGGIRAIISPVQIAMAVRPKVIRSGRPFEIVVLAQNTIDTDVDITLILKLPEKDNKGKKQPFQTHKDRITVGIKSGEVGYLAFPVKVSSHTVPGTYTIDLEVKTQKVGTGKGEQIRKDEGGAAFEIAQMHHNQVVDLQKMHKLTFTANKKSGLF